VQGGGDAESRRLPDEEESVSRAGLIGPQIAPIPGVNSAALSVAVPDVASWLASDGAFGVLPSRAKPRLLLPLDSKLAAHASVNLYNGHWTWRGRLKRKLFHLAVSMGARVYGHDRVVPLPDSDSRFARLVREVTGEPRPAFAALLRTKFQSAQLSNLIVQAMRPDGEILGFLKIPLTPETAAFTRNEARNLERLSADPEIGASLPRILYAGEWEDGYVLFQSRVTGAPVAEMTGKHRRFLRTLARIDASARGGSCLTREMASLFEQVADCMGVEARGLAEGALRWAEEALDDAPVEYGFSHGDFAPSHTLMDGSKLFVFDWEYGGSHRPVTWDHFNFAVSAALGKRAQVDLSYLKERRGADTNALYVLYLLNMAFAVVRRKVAEMSSAGQPCCNLSFEPYQGLIASFLKRVRGAR
jgi:hypothetical protein